MEKQQYILNLSLKQLALRKVAVDLWNQADILPLVKSFRCQSRNDDDTIRKWQETVENKVKEKVPMLLLPNSLTEDLMHVIKPIGPEILKWRMQHESLTSNSYSALIILDKLRWTSVGTVDYKKTAELLIRQEQLDLTSCYKLACLYCLEEDIRIIWEKLSKDTKNFFYDEITPLHIRQPELVVFWTYLIKGQVAMLDGLVNRNRDGRQRTPYQYAFECASRSGNKAATEYFFQKLTFEEREVSLLETTQSIVDKRCCDVYTYPYDFPKEKFCDVVRFLLSRMKTEEQVQVFKKFPYRTLRCFMDWPWQDVFMKVAGIMWSFLSREEYYSLIVILARNRTMTGYNYPKLFGEFFLRAPNRCRSYIIDKHRENGFWFRDLMYANNTELIKLVLRNVDDEDRPGFIICNPGCHLCVKLLKEGKWSLLELFVSECRLSSTDKTLLKETFKKYVTIFYWVGIKPRGLKIQTFFKLIDNKNVNDDNKIIIEDAEKEEQSTSNEHKRKHSGFEIRLMSVSKQFNKMQRKKNKAKRDQQVMNPKKAKYD